MATQLEEEGFTGVKRLPTHWSQANHTVSALIQMTEQSPDPDRIWKQVEEDFIRLSESPTRDIRLLSPQKALKAAREVELRSIKDTAISFGRHENDINRYRGILGAALSLSLQREGLISEIPSTVNQSKYQQLKMMHEEASTIASAVNQPKVKKHLALMPDLAAMLDSFQQYSTVRLFLETNGVPYNPRYIGVYNIDLRSYLFGHETPRMARILRRATLSRWINRHTDWHGATETEINGRINQGAELIYSLQTPPGQDKKARCIRIFLRQVISEELELARKSILKSCPHSLIASANGVPIRDISDVDILGTFQLYTSFAACPETLKAIVQKYIELSTPLHTCKRLATDRYKHLAYTSEYKKRWVEGGFTFLENVLLLKPEEVPSWENLTVEKRCVLRQFRKAFQQALGKLKS